MIYYLISIGLGVKLSLVEDLEVLGIKEIFAEDIIKTCVRVPLEK
jgi:hypothetical protein